MGMLNSSKARQGIPAPIGVDHIWSKAKLSSLLYCLHFLIVCFMNFIQASTCPLLLWWYDEVMAWFVFRHLQNSWNHSETKFVPTSETYFFTKAKFGKCSFGCPYQVFSQHAFHLLNYWKLSVVIKIQNKVSLLTIRIFAPATSHYLAGISWAIVFPAAAYSVLQGRLSSVLLHFLYWYSCVPNIQICTQATLSSQLPCDCCATGSISASAVEKILWFLCL